MGALPDGDRGHAKGICSRCISQNTGRGNRRLATTSEQRRVGVVRDVVGKRLAVFIRAATGIGCGEAIHGFRASILDDLLVAERGEAGRVVDRVHGDGELLRRAGRNGAAIVAHADGDLGASEKLMFWLREHGALAGKSVAAALEAGTALAKVERLAAAWARERGASRVTAAA